jgi:hypothetical protein
MVVDHLHAKSQNENIGVACMYLNHKEAEDQTPVKLLFSLWRQFIFGRDLGSFAKKLYQQHQEKCTTPTLDEVMDLLCLTITDFSQIYIIIDAVDEYPETQRQILLDCLAMRSLPVNLMITSWPHIAPDSSLPNPTTLEIQANEEDIRKYVDAQIHMLLRLKKHVQSQANLQEEIHSKITHTVDGM